MYSIARIAVAALLVLLIPQGAAAQTLGVVWDPPADGAEAQLSQIAATGFDAVRVPAPFPAPLKTLADSLGIQVFQDLPLVYRTGVELQDTLAWVLRSTARLDSTLAVGVGAFSVLASDYDCGFFQTLDAALSQPLYVTRRPETAFPCSAHVEWEFVAEPDYTPATSASGNKIIGIPHGRSAQPLIDYLAGSQGELHFVHRWRDQDNSSSFAADPLAPAYGIWGPAEGLRNVGQAVRAYTSVGQHIVETTGDDSENHGSEGLLVSAWLIAALLVGLTARSASFLPTTDRYFRGHAFYRAGVAEARTQMAGSLAVLLVVVALATGLLASFLIQSGLETDAFQLLWHRSGVSGRDAMDWILTQGARPLYWIPAAFVLLYLLWSVLWATVLGRKSRLRLREVLIVGLWPQWGTIVLLIPTLLLATSQAPVRPAWLLITWIGSLAWASVRTTLDLIAVSHPGIGARVALIVLSLPVLGALAATLLWTSQPALVARLISQAAPW